MHRVQRIFLLLMGAALLHSCDLIEYHPYDTRTHGATQLTEKHIARIEAACAGKDTIRFAHISDTQRWYDETEQLVKAINGREDVDFVIHCGDQTDFGLTKEFEWQRNILQKLRVPYVCLLGNHDCLGTGERVYQKIYGEPNFSFQAGFVHFACLNTNAVEYDYSAPVPDFEWIRRDIDSTSTASLCTVVAMHAMPGTEQFNNNVSEYFNYVLNQYPDLRFCMAGHDHQTKVCYPYENGVPYFECACAKRKTYIVYTLTRNDYRYEIVQL